MNGIGKTIRNVVITSCVFCVASGCASSPQGPAPAASILGGSAKPRDPTTWRTDGYGYVIDLYGGDVKLYDITQNYCVLSEDRGEQLAKYLVNSPKAFMQNGDEAEFRTPFEKHPIRLKRIARLPEKCVQNTPNTPQSNFDAFVGYFETHYAFFDLYNVNWNEAVAVKRPLVHAETSDEELYNIMRDLMRPLKDGHISLSAEINDRKRKFKANPSIISETLANRAKSGKRDESDSDAFFESFWIQGVGQKLLKNKGNLTGGYFIQYGLPKDDIGYIGFLTVAGYAGGKLQNEKADLAELNKAMDKALARFEKAKVKAVIVDLSANMGGYDFISRAIAERFADQKRLAYSKYASDSNAALPTQLYISPHSGKRYLGPVYVLTSNATVSGGEILTMSLRTLPNVTHAGQTTRGALSDVLDKQLPNGWELSLSNEVYSDAEGRNWEGRGIPPNLPLTVFDPENLEGSHLNAVRKLIQHIDEQH